MELKIKIRAALNVEPVNIEPLAGGSVSNVYGVLLSDGRRIVAKVARAPGTQMETEAFMLRYLAESSPLPVPAVFHASDDLLLLEYIPGSSSFSALAQEDAAHLLAQLHTITSSRFGLERPTLIGGLHQPNPWTNSWLDFFREQRLLYMGREALNEGRISSQLYDRLVRFCGQLENWLHAPQQASLIHGDAWTGNILAGPSAISGFIDPAIYYADPEIELAFTTLFGTFSDAFFRRYRELRPIRPGFMTVRKDIYNLYPLLVHVRLFGGSYVSSVEKTLYNFGC